MKTFMYVEDYIEVINGDRNPDTGKPYGLFENTGAIISLARYDVNILSSMSSATVGGRSLTDKQAELAVKIVLKYQKQLANLGIDVAPVEQPKFRYAIRTIDRRKLLDIDGDRILLKFPYDNKLIESVRELARLSQGSWKFDGDSKVWLLGLTETNIVAAYGFAVNNDFEISAEVKRFVQLVLDSESQPYEIKLVATHDNNYTITNAAPGLINYIDNWCGFGSQNLDMLVDAAPILGYTVDDTIAQEITSKYSPRIYNLMTAQETKFSPTSNQDVFTDIIEYARITGRGPIYVYEPDLSGRLLNGFVNQCFASDQIYRATALKQEPIAVDKKVIYFHKFSASWAQPIKLLISGQGMMHGGDKSLLLQRAEKVVYFAAEIYNAHNQRRA
jgi:hypothetical protein